MPGDRFDRLLVVAIVVALVTAAGLLWSQGQGQADSVPPVDRALEQSIAARARLTFLEQTYAPVVALQQEGQDQQALFKLKELDRRYPGEAQGDILRARSLQRVGALPEALAAAVRAVRRTGDYVDRNSPFSQRPLIQGLVDAGLKQLGPQARQAPDNQTLAVALKDVHYLQSRLAGGCE